MKNVTRDTNPSLVRSLDKALRVLGLLAQEHEDIDLGSLAKQAGLPKSTLIRLLSTMRAHGIIQQNPKTRRYRLGWALVRLGKAAERQFDLPRIIHPFLERLAQETGETASLAVRTGEYAFYVDQVLSQNVIRGAPPTGAALDLHSTAVGKLLLSNLEETEVEQLIHECGLPQRTEKTISNMSRLRRELAVTRSRGYAVDNEEAELGGRCIAAPIHDGNGTILAALSITAPTSRLTLDRMAEYVEIVCSIAEQASNVLCSGTIERKGQY